MERERLQAALDRFDALNAADPRTLVVDGVERPRELVQAERLERWVLRLAPDPSVPLRLAARSQHLQRWAIARSDFPEGRIGYLEWRKALARHHAKLAGEVLGELGWDADTIEAVRAIQLKRGLKTDPDTQVMEDALCLSFLEHEFVEFAAKHDDPQVIDLVQKTWRKMSAAGHAEALGLPLPEMARRLVEAALSQSATPLSGSPLPGDDEQRSGPGPEGSP